MQNFIATIFDMDGLLLDSERLALKTFQATCSNFNLGDMTDLFKRCIGANAKLGESILENGLKGIADFREFGREWTEAYHKATEEKAIPLMNGVEQLLKHIEILGIPMAVATSTETDRAQAKLRASGILDYFKIIVGGDQVSKSKPNPDIYLKAASELSSDPHRCLALEDSANGVKAAMAAGMTVVQIPDLIQPDEELLKMGHIVLSSLADVPEYDFKR